MSNKAYNHHKLLNGMAQLSWMRWLEKQANSACSPAQISQVRQMMAGKVLA